MSDVILKYSLKGFGETLILNLKSWLREVKFSPQEFPKTTPNLYLSSAGIFPYCRLFGGPILAQSFKGHNQEQLNKHKKYRKDC